MLAPASVLVLALLTAAPAAPSPRDAPPKVGLAVALSVNVPPEREQNVLGLIAQGLAEGGLPTVRVRDECKADVSCLRSRAQARGLDGLILVTLAPGSRGVAVDLDALELAKGASIAQLTFTAGSTLDAERARSLQAFAVQVRANLPVTGGPPPVTDVPVAQQGSEVTPPVLEPAAPVTEPQLGLNEPRQPPRRRSSAPWIVGGSAAVAGGGSGLLYALGRAAEASANANVDGRSELTRAEAEDRIERANRRYTGAAIAGAAAGALLTTAIVLWIAED